MWPKPQLGRLWRSPMFIIGAVMMIGGASPLLLFGVLTADPNPNPVGLEILFTFLFWPGLALALAAFGRFAGPALPGRPKDDVDRVV